MKNCLTRQTETAQSWYKRTDETKRCRTVFAARKVKKIMGVSIDSSAPHGEIAEIYKRQEHERLNEPAIEKIDDGAKSWKLPIPTEIVYLRSNLKQRDDGANEIALFERDEHHPSGEVFVAGEQIVAAALTKKVTVALKDGLVIEVTKAEYDSEQETRERELAESHRRQVESEKEEARKKYIQAFSSDAGFEQAWDSLSKAETLARILK